MTYPYVQAAFDYGAQKGPALAFVVHMAEGGGTVGYLSRSPDRGVSVHYVIEYSGRIVQMLHEDRASGSINPNELRTTDDADHFYGVTVRKSVMGSWDHDPNSAVISLEIEGFATAGPNLAQGRSLIALVDDVRSRHPAIGLLGHRDFTDTKACPGRHIDWPALGGHGPHTASVTEATMPTLSAYTPGYTITVKPTANVRFDAKVSAGIRRVVLTAEVWDITGSVKGDVDGGSDVWYVRWHAGTWEYTAKANVTAGPTAPVAAPDPAAVAAATKTARGLALEEAHTAGVKGAGDAIDALPR